MSNEEKLAQLLQEMKVTKGSRFNATERLRKRDRSRTYITAASSVAVIMLTVFPLMFHLSEILTSLLNFFTIAMSVIILVYSLLQYSSGDPVVADQHHRCALEINALRRAARNADQIDKERLQEISIAYDNILQRYSVNHEPIDFERYKVEHPTEYPSSKTDQKTLRKDERSAESGEPLVKGILTATISTMLFVVILILVSVIANISGVEIFSDISRALEKSLK